MRGTGRGQFTHMGRIAFETQHCGRYRDGEWDGAMTFVAAGGSTILSTCSGGSTPDVEALGADTAVEGIGDLLCRHDGVRVLTVHVFLIPG